MPTKRWTPVARRPHRASAVPCSLHGGTTYEVRCDQCGLLRGTYRSEPAANRAAAKHNRKHTSRR